MKKGIVALAICLSSSIVGFSQELKIKHPVPTEQKESKQANKKQSKEKIVIESSKEVKQAPALKVNPMRTSKPTKSLRAQK